MKLNNFYIILLLIFFSSYGTAQEIINYPETDKKTYNQYLNKDWAGLIKTGKKSLKYDIDFYYLQVRMGIAYYELKKYPKAVKYFENAYKQNKTDELIQEYLYFSYIFTGRYEDARVLGGTFKRELKKKLSISAEHPFISALYLDTKHDINEDYKYIPDLTESLSQKVITDQSYYNVSLEHLIGDKITVFHGYSNIGITNIIYDNNISLPPVYEEKIRQNEYYVSIKAQIAKGLNLSGGLHYLNTNYFAPNPLSSGRMRGYLPLYNYSGNSFAAAINISKHFSLLRIAAGTSFANMNNKIQIQPELSIKVYPFGNSKIYTESKVIHLIENDWLTITHNPVYKQSLGINFLKYSWFIPSFTYGNMKNFTEYNAFIANNDVDLTKQKYEALLNIGFKKGTFNILFKYQYNIKENEFEVNNTEQFKEYVNQSITVGIKWYFKKY
ncbi:MAG: hypothetical protein L3J35_05210 [Bacteroidales bacterium]|nr:hypothetical protein [Bacteroidales bacterium]